LESIQVLLGSRWTAAWEGGKVKIASQEIHRHTKGKKMEKDGCKSFSKLHPTGANYGWANSAHRRLANCYKIVTVEECKRLSAKYDVCLLDLAALGAPQR
jgi:hypothetical protein